MFTVSFKEYCKALEWIAQGDVGFTVPVSVWRNVGCGTYGHGLVGNICGRGMVGADGHGGLFQHEQVYDCIFLYILMEGKV